MLLQDREDVLEEVELLVAGGRPEVVTVDRQALLFRLALPLTTVTLLFLPNGGLVSTISKYWPPWWATRRGSRLARRRLRRTDAVQQHVHAAQPRHAVHQLHAEERAVLEPLLLLAIELVVRDRQIVVSRQQEAAGAAGRVADGHLRLRTHHVHDRGDQRPRGEVLSGAALDVLGVLLEQPFVGVALHVGGERRPLLPIDQIDDQPPQFGRILDLVLGLAEDHAQHALLPAERLQHVTIVDFQIVAVLQQAGPVESCGNDRRLVVRRPLCSPPS